MIVAMFTNNYLPHVSGVATSITRLERGLTKRGHTVHIVAPKFFRHHDESATVHRVPSLGIPGVQLPLPLLVPAGLARTLQTLSPDIIHAHHPFLLGRLALAMARRLRRPIVFTYHAMYEEYTHYVPLLPRQWLRARVIRQALDFAQQVDAVIAPSASIANILRERGLRTPLHVIPTGIATELFVRNAAVRRETRTAWGIREHDLVIVSFARISHEKNFRLLLDAFALLRAREVHERLHLRIGGDGPEKAALRAYVEQRGLSESVRFVGHLPHEAVPSFLAGGDLFAYPSSSETQGLVTLEALAAGLPAVVVDAPGNRDIVEHERSGLVTVPTAEGLAAALEDMVLHADRRAAFAARARERADAFSVEHMAEQVEALYASLRAHAG